MRIPISEILVNAGRRDVAPRDIQELADSIAEIGLLHPITVDSGHTLIAGLHRLEAAKLLNWTEIECIVSDLDGLQAELAEIDENFVRADLSPVDYGNLLLRRKEIYETLHPETKNGGDRRSENFRTKNFRSDSVKSFAQDTAKKLGVTPRTVEMQVQTAKNLTAEAKSIIKGTDARITKTDAMKLSRLSPEQQSEAASQLAAGEIKSMAQYQSLPAETSEVSQEEFVTSRSVPYSLGNKHFATLEESIADLKDPNKDCHYTLDAMLADMDGFVDRFQSDFEWYTWPVCTEFFPKLSKVQLEFVQERFNTIIATIQDLLCLMRSDNEGQHPLAALESEPAPPETVSPLPIVPYSYVGKHFASREESIADLKNPNKDCSYSPDLLLSDMDSFINNFHKEIAWYSYPFCTVVFPDISPVQLAYLRQRFGTISEATNELLKQIQKSMERRS